MRIRERLKAVLRTTPRRFQVQGVRFLERRRGRALIGDDMGLGKTFQALAWLAIHPELRPAVIVCPATLKWNWRREAMRHTGLRAEVLSGRTPRPLRRDIVILNYDVLTAWLPILHAVNPTVLILDEVQKIKNRGAHRTKAAIELARQTPHVIGLSGTPITNRPAEFWPMLHIIEPKSFPTFFPYAFRYCGPRRGWRGRGWDFRGASHVEELHERVSELMIRRCKMDVLTELPPKSRVLLPLDGDNAGEYALASKQFIAWLALRRGVESAMRAAKAQAIVKMGELKRLAAQGKLTAIVDWLTDWLSATDEKIVLFTIHHDMTDAVLRRFPNALRVDGTVPGIERQQAIDRFQNDPQRRIIVGGLDSLGVGTTLTAASTVAFLELGWTPAEHDQAEDRVLRIGQTANVMEAFYFIARHTIEEDILKVLNQKRWILNQILDGREGGYNFRSATESVQNDVLQRLLQRQP